LDGTLIGLPVLAPFIFPATVPVCCLDKLGAGVPEREAAREGFKLENPTDEVVGEVNISPQSSSSSSSGLVEGWSEGTDGVPRGLERVRREARAGISNGGRVDERPVEGLELEMVEKAEERSERLLDLEMVLEAVVVGKAEERVARLKEGLEFEMGRAEKAEDRSARFEDGFMGAVEKEGKADERSLRLEEGLGLEGAVEKADERSARLLERILVGGFVAVAVAGAVTNSAKSSGSSATVGDALWKGVPLLSFLDRLERRFGMTGGLAVFNEETTGLVVFEAGLLSKKPQSSFENVSGCEAFGGGGAGVSAGAEVKDSGLEDAEGAL
jgi:hypothetical protein